jgi:hypothetical protein
MNSPNINPYVVDSWVRSGQAAETAQEPCVVCCNCVHRHWLFSMAGDK